MMTLALPVLFPAATAAPRVQSSFEIPEITVTSDVVMRQNFRSTVGLGALVDVVRTGKVDLEVGTQVLAPSVHLFQPGFARRVWSLEAMGDLLLTPGRFIGIGPTVLASVRTFDQAGWTVSTRVVPVVGGRVRLLLVDGPRMRVGLQCRVLADLVRTRLVFGTATVQEMAPVSVLGGLTVGFGVDHRIREGG
jgi:hypothetical protein